MAHKKEDLAEYKNALDSRPEALQKLCFTARTLLQRDIAGAVPSSPRICSSSHWREAELSDGIHRTVHWEFLMKRVYLEKTLRFTFDNYHATYIVKTPKE